MLRELRVLPSPHEAAIAFLNNTVGAVTDRGKVREIAEHYMQGSKVSRDQLEGLLTAFECVASIFSPSDDPAHTDDELTDVIQKAIEALQAQQSFGWAPA